MNASGAAYAADYLRTHDRDSYFATLVLPERVWPAVQALYAFSADIAAVRDRVSEPAPGEIRLQWWSDALSGEGHGLVRQNPLAEAVLDAIARFDLPTAPLLRLIAARRFDLYQDPMPDLPTFEGYAGETVSVLCQLAAMTLNQGATVATGDAAGHLGVAQALVGHLRAFGYNAARGRIFLPLSILTANGVREQEVLAGTSSEGLLAALGQIHELAAEHLRRARAALALVDGQLRPAFARMAWLGPELRRINTAAARPFAVPDGLPDWQKLARLGWWSWRNR